MKTLNTKVISTLSIWGLILAGSVGTIQTAQAQVNTPGFTIPDTSPLPPDLPGDDFTTAWNFQIDPGTNILDLTALGVYVGDDGIVNFDRTVRLWDVATGNLLASTVIAQGSTPAPGSTQPFAFGAPDTPVQLLPGAFYRVGLYYPVGEGGDNTAFDNPPGILNFDPRIIPTASTGLDPVTFEYNEFFVLGQTGNGGTDIPPDTDFFTGSIITGANFLVSDSGGSTTVPEPSLAIGLIILGLGSWLTVQKPNDF